MSRYRKGVARRAAKGERASLLLTTTAGSVAALAGLDAMQVGQVLDLIYRLGAESSIQSEYITRPGVTIAPAPPTERRPTRA